MHKVINAEGFAPDNEQSIANGGGSCVIKDGTCFLIINA